MAGQDLLFAKTHEWVRLEETGGGTIATVGISAFAVEALTDVVHLELPGVGKKVRFGDSLGEIESVKAVSDIYSPVSGEVVEVNTALRDQPESLNEDCYGAGWIAKLKVSGTDGRDELLDRAAYEKLCAAQGH